MHEKGILCFFRFLSLFFQMRMRSLLLVLMGQQTCVFAWIFLKTSVKCLRTSKPLTRLLLCTGLLEPLLVAYMIKYPFIYLFIFFFFFFWFGFYGPFKNISLISSRSFIEGGRKPEYPEKNHLTIRKQNLAFPHMTRARLEPQRWET